MMLDSSQNNQKVEKWALGPGNALVVLVEKNKEKLILPLNIETVAFLSSLALALGATQELEFASSTTA